MSTTITAGWLNDKNGDKFAPKTLVSQVQTNDGTLLEDLLGDFIIRARKTASGDSIDKTMEEIKEAYNAGRAIYCDYSSVNAGGFVNRLSLTARNSDTSWAFMGLITETTVATVVLNNTSIAETYTNLGTINQISVDGKSLTNTAGSVAIPKASILQYGVVKLSAATNSSSATLGATASAVKSVYDLANSKLDASLKGAASGVAELDSTGKIPTTQIPSEYITETELTNKNYITKAVSDLTNYYTKSNTYTKTEVNELVSANDNFFIAEYGVTTFEEIVEAANTDKKTVLCRINDVGTIFTLAYCHADGARFIGYTAYGEQEACCEPNNEWTISNIGIQADWNQNDETALDYIKNRPLTLKNPNAITFTGAVTGTYDGSSAKTVNIPVAPTKTSQLTNDSGFLTSIPTEYVTETELINKNYITKAVSDLTNYYTKTQVDNKISQIPKFDIEVVTSLPTSNISDTTVYLVNSGIAGDDLYTEYIYVNNAWEVLGVQRVDLTNYATKDEIPTALKNPNALTFTGAVTGTYDGSSAKTVNIPAAPTKTSQLTNDSGFLTSIPTEYVTETELTNKNYATKNEIPTSLKNPNAITFTGAVTGTYDGSSAKTVNIPTQPTKTSQLTNDSGYAVVAEVEAVDARVNEKGIHYIVGNSTTAGVWTGACDNITEYFDGLTIAYKINVAGVSGGTTLNINNLGAIAVKRNASTAVTTIYPVGSVVILTYSGGSWLTADYDANSKNTAGSSNKVDTKLYLVGGASQSSSGVTTYTNKNVYIGTDNCLYSNGVKVATADDIAGANSILIAEYGSTAFTTIFEAVQEQGKAVFCLLTDGSILPLSYAHIDQAVFIGYGVFGTMKQVICTEAGVWSQADYALEVKNGGTGCTSITDTTYTTARYRASSLHNSTTTPTVNGVIAWQYA